MLKLRICGRELLAANHCYNRGGSIAEWRALDHTGCGQSDCRRRNTSDRHSTRRSGNCHRRRRSNLVVGVSACAATCIRFEQDGRTWRPPIPHGASAQRPLIGTDGRHRQHHPPCPSSTSPPNSRLGLVQSRLGILTPPAELAILSYRTDHAPVPGAKHAVSHAPTRILPTMVQHPGQAEVHRHLRFSGSKRRGPVACPDCCQ